MKKEIVGILIFTLFISTLIFPASGKMTTSLNINKNLNEYFLLENINFPLNEGLDNYIINEMNVNHIPGMSATIVKDDNVFWTNSYGYANISNDKLVENTTLFFLASISKTIVATAIMQLYEQDFFDLYDPINNYLPFQVNHPNYPSVDITFHMLMTHTSSINDNWLVMPYFDGDPTMPLGEYLEEYLTPEGEYYDSDLNFYNEEPGTYYGYSNIGAALVAYLVETISNVSFSEYCEINVFQPLDMPETAWFLADLDISNIAVPYQWDGDEYDAYPHYSNNWFPSACLRTSVTQLRNLLMMMMNDGLYNSSQILEEGTVDLMLTQQLEWVSHMGLIWYKIDLDGRTLWGHGGSLGGCRTRMFFEPETNIGVIILTNGEYDGLHEILSKLFDFAENEPPYIPSDPAPEDDSTDVSIYTDLSWTGGDPNDDSVTYDVYFEAGDSTPDELVSDNQTDTTYDPGTLEENTEYYWQIISWDEFTSTSGPIWKFTTGENLPPYEPSNPDPEDGATDVSINKKFEWAGGDPNEGDVVTYDVYFGDEIPPPLVAEDLSEEAYDPGTLELLKTYYWQIVSEDSQGLTTDGQIWSFTTEEKPNEPPSAPDIDGPSKGSPGQEICWTFHSDDPEENDVKYIIDWGDGNSEETDYYPSCSPIEGCHTYAEEGTFIITATAEDLKGDRSDESTFEVEIPRIRAPSYQWFEWLLERFPLLERLLSYMLL